MGILVYVLGRSGTGKSFSMRNFKKGEIGVVNVQGKILPFKGSGLLDIVNTDNSVEIVRAIESMAKKYKVIVVDDFQYVMANEFMRRATERGYDKFTEIARHAWDIADVVKKLPADVIVYVMCHTDTDQDGFEKLKTIGRLLDEKIVLEGMSTIVLKTAVSDGEYMFLTQNSGKDTVKSPAGMFPTYAIDNDLKYVDAKIRNYYEIGEYVNDEEVEKMDQTVAKEAVVKPDSNGRRSRRKKDDAVQKSAEPERHGTADGQGTVSEPTPTTEPAAEPKTRRRKARNEEPEEVVKKDEKPLEKAVNEPSSLDFETAQKEFEEIKKSIIEVDGHKVDANTGEVLDAPRRRRRKANTVTVEEIKSEAPILDINDADLPF